MTASPVLTGTELHPERPPTRPRSAAAPGGPESPRPGLASRLPSLVTSLAALIAALPYLLDLYRLVGDRANPYPMQGDGAVEALSSLQASRLHQLLGPYSRYGFNHPGPALFYWLALPYRLFGPRGPGMYVGVVLLNLVAVAAVVMVVGRRWGPAPAMWAVVCLTVLRLALGASFFSNLWNPYVIVVPMILLIVLAADGATGTTGSTASVAWAVVVGSFVVQTSISTGPAVATVVLIALIAWVIRRRRGDPGAVITRGALAGLVVAAIAWVPPLLDALQGRSSNLYRVAKFFTTAHPTHTLKEAVSSSLASVTSVPYGIQVSPAETMARSHGRLLLGAAAIVVLAGATLVVSHVRRQRFAWWLAVTSLAGLAAGVVGATRIVGPIYFYLPLWQAFGLVTLLLALGASFLGPRGAPKEVPEPEPEPKPEPVTAAGARRLIILTVAVTLAAATLSVVALRHTTLSSGPEASGLSGAGTDVYRSADAIEGHLRPDEHLVRLTIGTDAVWPLVAGVAVDLETHGRSVRIAGTTQDWTFTFGRHFRSTGREPVDLEFFPADVALPAAARGTPLATVDQVVILIDRPGGPGSP